MVAKVKVGKAANGAAARGGRIECRRDIALQRVGYAGGIAGAGTQRRDRSRNGKREQQLQDEEINATQNIPPRSEIDICRSVTAYITYHQFQYLRD